MNLMELHDARIKRAGLRGMLAASASIAAAVAVGVSLLTAPVQVVASGAVEKQNRATHMLQTQVDEQARDIRDLRAIVRTCFAPSTMCGPVNEPLVASNRYTPPASTNDSSPVTVRRVTERTTRVETKQQPTPAKTTPPKDTPKPEPDPVTKPVGDATKQVTDTVDGLLDTVAKASAK